jgi:hypothetical protein
MCTPPSYLLWFCLIMLVPVPIRTALIRRYRLRCRQRLTALTRCLQSIILPSSQWADVGTGGEDEFVSCDVVKTKGDMCIEGFQ